HTPGVQSKAGLWRWNDPAPHSVTVHQEEIEEERRLFYVALTRAEQKIHLTHANTRYRFGKQKIAKPSRFLKEIAHECIQIKNLATPQPQVTPQTNPYTSMHYKALSDLQAHTNESHAQVNQLKVGQKVKHPIFGIGQIEAIYTDAPHQKIKINFEIKGAKTLLLRFAKLSIL
ncbi:MAG: 3'-5' exonuclease, partial [Bacteroidota bacterium]